MYMTVELPERLSSKIEKTDGCWEWLASKTDGYGRYYDNGRNHMAHRFVYRLLVGPIPPDLQCDHLCRNRSCVNPDHIELVTQQENIARGDATIENARPARIRSQLARTHCKNGHPWSEENTYRRPDNGTRQCRACVAARMKARRADR